MATVPTATTGHDNEPGSRMTVLALVNECKRRPAVEVRETHKSTVWEEGTLTAYAPLSECGGVAFTVVVVRGGVDTILTVSQDRVKFPTCPRCGRATTAATDAAGAYVHTGTDLVMCSDDDLDEQA